MASKVALTDIEFYGELLENLRRALTQGDFPPLSQQLATKELTREKAKAVIELLLHPLRAALYAKLGYQESAGGFDDTLVTYFQRFSSEALVEMMERLLLLQHYLDLNTNKDLTLQNALLTMAYE